MNFKLPLSSVRNERFGPKMVVVVFSINSVVVAFSKRSHFFARRIIYISYLVISENKKEYITHLNLKF